MVFMSQWVEMGKEERPMAKFKFNWSGVCSRCFDLSSSPFTLPLLRDWLPRVLAVS